jgi:hypothetical protein
MWMPELKIISFWITMIEWIKKKSVFKSVFNPRNPRTIEVWKQRVGNVIFAS